MSKRSTYIRISPLYMLLVTHLANALENTDCMLEVSDVEDWYYKLDVRIVADTFHRGQSTRLAKRTLLCRALRSVQDRKDLHLAELHTRRRSRTPFLTGRRSIGVYRSRWVTSNSEILTASWLLRRLNCSFLLWSALRIPTL